MSLPRRGGHLRKVGAIGSGKGESGEEEAALGESGKPSHRGQA